MDKPIKYAELPVYNESTQYVTENTPVEMDDCFLIEYEVKEMIHTENIEPIASGTYEPCVKEPTIEERVDTVETKTVTIEETLDVLLGGA